MALYADYTDEELMPLVRGSDEGAFTALYERFSGVLYVYAFKMVRDEDVAEDLVQELFVQLWDRRKQGEDVRSVASYLFRAVRYKFFDWVDRERVRGDYMRRFQGYLAENATVERVEEKELRALIEAEMDRLPEKMREVFRLSREEGLTPAEIAERLGISEKTAKNQIGNALKIMRVRLGMGVFLFFLFHS